MAVQPKAWWTTPEGVVHHILDRHTDDKCSCDGACGVMADSIVARRVVEVVAAEERHDRPEAKLTAAREVRCGDMVMLPASTLARYVLSEQAGSDGTDVMFYALALCDWSTHTPRSLLLSTSPRHVIGNGRLPEHILSERVLVVPAWHVDGLISDPGCPDLAAAAAASGVPIRRASAAVNGQCPPHVLERLAHDSDRFVRSAVANTPAPASVCGSALETLAADTDPNVRGAVARRPDCPERLLERLAADPYRPVRFNAVRNPACPHDILASAAVAPMPEPEYPDGYINSDWMADVRGAAASNPKATPEVVKAIVNAASLEMTLGLVDTDPDRASAVLTSVLLAVDHPACPPDSVRDALAVAYSAAAAASAAGLTGEPLVRVDWVVEQVLRSVASSPSCPPEAFSQLAADRWDSVRKAVAGNDAAPDDARAFATLML